MQTYLHNIKIRTDTGKSMFQEPEKVSDTEDPIEYKLPEWMIGLYDETCNIDIGKNKEYEVQGLDIRDLMFENRIGIARDLTEKPAEM